MTIEMRVVAAWAAVSLGIGSGASMAATQGPPVAAGREASAPHVKVDLIADTTRSAAGRFWLGVRFRLDEHWHLYWQNPGDSGAAPTAAWKTDSHVTVGPFEWPAPNRIDVGGLINYGYHGSIVLPAPAVVAAGGASPGRVTVALRWLVCRDMCVPGKADLSLDLNRQGASPMEVATWRAAIAEARGQVPPPAPVDWKATATAGREAFELIVRTGRREPSALFFPLQPSQIDDAAPQVGVPLGDGVRLTLRKSAQLAGIPASLSGVLRLEGHTPVVIEAPLVR